MANIIAVVWDFDKTLVNGYMEEPIFEHYGVDSSVFWREVNSLPEKYRVEQGVRVNPDTIYLNHFIHYAKKGIFKGLVITRSKGISFSASPVIIARSFPFWFNGSSVHPCKRPKAFSFVSP